MWKPFQLLSITSMVKPDGLQHSCETMVLCSVHSTSALQVHVVVGDVKCLGGLLLYNKTHFLKWDILLFLLVGASSAQTCVLLGCMFPSSLQKQRKWQWGKMDKVYLKRHVQYHRCQTSGLGERHMSHVISGLLPCSDRQAGKQTDRHSDTHTHIATLKQTHTYVPQTDMGVV